MLRVGLVSYLLFVLVAGPCFCCCSLNRLVDHLTPLTSSEKESVPTCCHCSGSSSNKSPANKSTKQPQPKPNKKCPCKESRGSFLGTDHSSWDNTKWSQSQFLSPFDAFSVDGHANLVCKANQKAAFARRRQSHFGTILLPRILSILQMLLC